MTSREQAFFSGWVVTLWPQSSEGWLKAIGRPTPITDHHLVQGYLQLVFSSSLLILINLEDKLQQYGISHWCSICLFQHPLFIRRLQPSEPWLLSLCPSASFTTQCWSIEQAARKLGEGDGQQCTFTSIYRQDLAHDGNGAIAPVCWKKIGEIFFILGCREPRWTKPWPSSSAEVTEAYVLLLWFPNRPQQSKYWMCESFPINHLVASPNICHN